MGKTERLYNFKDLGKILREDDDDTKYIEHQLNNAQKKWKAFVKML